MRKFLNLMQRKVYSLAYPGYSFVGITATPDLEKVNTIKLPYRTKDIEEAQKWIERGFKTIKEDKDFAPKNARNCHRCVYKYSCEKTICR
jgi:CRISPR/Cas system-associated exonuclease Cas4 (RecB family)